MARRDIMEDKIKKCKDMLLGLDKLSINELNYLLINKSRENQNKFILGFMHYIFSMAYSLYQKRPSYFRDGYDFEEFFSDPEICFEGKSYDESWSLIQKPKNGFLPKTNINILIEEFLEK